MDPTNAAVMGKWHKYSPRCSPSKADNKQSSNVPELYAAIQGGSTALHYTVQQKGVNQANPYGY